jgi:hypothetical protein
MDLGEGFLMYQGAHEEPKGQGKTQYAPGLLSTIKLLNDDAIFDFIDNLAKSLNRPCFIPVTHRFLENHPSAKPGLNLGATYLATALQMIKFAPVKNVNEITYSDDASQYEHRFPTPDAIGSCQRRKMLGEFS